MTRQQILMMMNDLLTILHYTLTWKRLNDFIHFMIKPKYKNTRTVTVKFNLIFIFCFVTCIKFNIYFVFILQFFLCHIHVMERTYQNVCIHF